MLSLPHLYRRHPQKCNEIYVQMLVCVLLKSCAFASLEFKDTEYLSNLGAT